MTPKIKLSDYSSKQICQTKKCQLST